MELVKAVSQRGSVSPDSIAIRGDQKSHSYHQLILSARKISSLLLNANSKNVSGNCLSFIFQCVKAPAMCYLIISIDTVLLVLSN